MGLERDRWLGALCIQLAINRFNIMKKFLIRIGALILVVGAFYVVIFWYPSYIKARHLAEGWVEPSAWDCPDGHPIKANLKSMIYHMPYDQYWSRTNAMNGECFDTAANARHQGFRPIFNGN